MEEELNYAMVTFINKDVSTCEKPNNMEIIYEEVKTEEQASDIVIPGNIKEAPLYSLPHLVAASLGIIGVILVSIIIALVIYLDVVISEQKKENIILNREKEELIRDREKLNWTIEAILEYKNFPVDTYCPQKVCKPCLDDWVMFQSNCYLFTKSNYSIGWKTWSESLDDCKRIQADLVAIESQEEQEFISNQTKSYHDKNHGYWIGLKNKSPNGPWMWGDEKNTSVTYWNPEQHGNKGFCALSVPHADPLANWHKTGCTMKNRWICEKRALIKLYQE